MGKEMTDAELVQRCLAVADEMDPRPENERDPEEFTGAQLMALTFRVMAEKIQKRIDRRARREA